MPTMSPGEFQVALGELRSATSVVRGESDHISGLIGQIQGRFDAAHSYWQSPSGTSFETMAAWFTKASHDLEELLQDMTRRMQLAYENYANAEIANVHNVGG
ncbi:WXG100 family type VII secretion target [Streptomyces sp. NPDC002547]